MRTWGPLGFTAGCLASAIYDDPWDRILLTGALTAGLFCVAVAVRSLLHNRDRRRAEMQSITVTREMWDRYMEVPRSFAHQQTKEITR